MDVSVAVGAHRHNDSDFQSEDEEAEFLLYTQLYFLDQDDLSTNCNNVPDQECNIPDDNVHTNLQIHEGESVCTAEKTGDVQNAYITTDKTTAEDIPVAAEKTPMEDVSLVTMEQTNVKYVSVVQEKSNVKSNVQDTFNTTSTYIPQGKYIVNRIDPLLSIKSRSILNDKCAAKISLANKERSKTIKQSNIDLFASSTCNKETANCHKFKNSHNILTSKRNRLSSICSEGSIPGSLPLDTLYCNVDLDDDIIEEDVEDKSKSYKPNPLIQIPTASKRINSRKRKICDTENIPQEYNEDDSKITTLIKLNEKLKNQEYKQRKKPKSVIETESDISCISEFNTRNHEVLDLITSSDDSDIKVISTTYSSPQKNILMNCKKPHLSDFNSSFQQTYSNKSSIHHGRQTNNNLGSECSDINVLSDTDDDFYDIEVAGGGTDLIFNVSNSLSSFVNKLSKPSRTTGTLKNKKNTNRKVPYVRRSFDYTLNRPDTKTKPSCDKWSQEMTNFYDSDVSEECDVSDIHQQQSDSPADWSIISGDYWSYLNKSNRYYSKERCTLCREFGHSRNNCNKVAHCYLCSKTDHSNRRDCPHNCCFKCGGPFHHFCAYTLRSVTCTRCGFSGHRQEQCPVNWRIYHVTVSGRVAMTRECEPTRKIYCCHCSRKGHFNYMCTQWHHSVNTYLPVPQAIFTPQSKMVDYVKAMEGNKQLRNEDTTHSTDHKLQKISAQRFIDKKQKRALMANNEAILKELEMKSGTKMQIESVKQRGVVYIEGTNDAVTRAVNMLKTALKNVKNVNTAFQTFNADWCYNFLKKVNGNKTILLRELQNYITELWNPVYVSEKILFKKLKRLKYYYDLGQKYNMPKNDNERYTRRRDLKIISMLLTSHVDQTVIQHISELKEEVRYNSSSIIPKSLCEKISVTLASVFAPPVEAIESILKRAFFSVKSLSVDMAKMSKERKKYDFNMYDMDTYEDIDCEPVSTNSGNVPSLFDKKVEHLMALQNRKKSKKLKKIAKAKMLKGSKFSKGKESGTPEECEITVLQGEATHNNTQQQQQHEENIAQIHTDAKVNKDQRLEDSPNEKVKINLKKEKSGKDKKKKKMKKIKDGGASSSDKTQECNNIYEDSPQEQPLEYLSTLKQKVKSGKVKRRRKKKKDYNSYKVDDDDDNVDTQLYNQEFVVQGEESSIGSVKKVKNLDRKVKNEMKKMKKGKRLEMERQGETEKKEKKVKKNKKVETEKKKVKKDKKVIKDNEEETEKKKVKREKKVKKDQKVKEAKKDKKLETKNKVPSEEGSHDTQPDDEKKKKKKTKVVGCKTIKKKFPNVVVVVGCDTD